MNDILQTTVNTLLDTGTQHLSAPASHFHCSGVLPYCIYGNTCYFILGKSRSGKLLTYTGKSEVDKSNGDKFEPPVVTASREFIEESLGAIISYDECLAACTACEADHVLVSLTPKNTLCYTFLIEVPHRRHYSTCFNKTRAFLDFIRMRDHHLCEFSEIKCICFDTLNGRVRSAWTTSGMLTRDDEWAKIQRIVQRHRSTSVHPKYNDDDGSADDDKFVSHRRANFPYDTRSVFTQLSQMRSESSEWRSRLSSDDVDTLSFRPTI